MNQFKNFIIPTKYNNHTPHLISRNAMLVYILVLFVFNFFVIQFGFAEINADVGITEVLENHNDERRKNGLTSLKYSESLSNSAESKAKAMLDQNCWSHYCPEDKSPWEYFFEADYDYIHAGENLAEGFYDIDSLMNAWMNSPTHKENILNSNFTEIGIGFAYGDFQGNPNNLVIAIHFGTPKEQIVNVSENLKNDSISISRPIQGEILESDIFDVEGSVFPENSEVEVLINNELNGRVIAEGEYYSYRGEVSTDGEYTLQTHLIDDEVILKKSEIIDITVDTIGNTNTEKSSEILEESSTDINPQDEKKISSTFDKAASQVANSDIRSLVAFSFMIYLLILFGVDYYFLKTTDMFENVNRNYHLNISIFIILFVTTAVSGIGGGLLTGSII